MRIPLNTSSSAILTVSVPRIAALLLFAAGVLAALLSLASRTDEARAERPVFARRVEAVPGIVVAAPADRGAGEVVVRIR